MACCFDSYLTSNSMHALDTNWYTITTNPQSISLTCHAQQSTLCTIVGLIFMSTDNSYNIIQHYDSYMHFLRYNFKPWKNQIISDDTSDLIKAYAITNK